MALPTPIFDDLTVLDFEAQFKADELTCDMEGCSNPASGWLVCASCGVGRETQCKPCRLETHGAWMRDPLYGIRFSGTCGHLCLYGACGWELITV